MVSQYLKPNPEGLKKIKHILVLMLENRSFDNLLGWLYDQESPPRGQHFEGLHRDLWNPLHSLDPNGIAVIEKVYVKKNGAPIKGTKYIPATPNPPPDFTQPHPDPGEGFRDTNHQLFQNYEVPSDYPPEPTNMGFVDNYVNTIVNGTYRMFGGSINDPRDIMTCFDSRSQVPVLSTLAREFAVCDHWHCSIPSQTLPNRAFIHAATSCGQVNNHPAPMCDAKTVYDQIDAKGGAVTWKVYASTPEDPDGKKDPSFSLTDSGKFFSLTRLMMTRLHDPSRSSHFRSIQHFYQDAKDGTLPSYAFLEPSYHGPTQNDQHPPSDIRAGEKLIADVYDAVVNSPQWEETLLVVTYDEHGGCHDHVPPGRATPPEKGSPAGQDGFTFNRFGVRVPTVLISPYIEAGTICRPAGWTPFDHTSLIKTVQNCFGLKGHLTQRDAAAPDLSCALTLKEPRKDKPPVEPLDFDSSPDAPTEVNDLHMSCEEALTSLTGKERPPDQHVHEFINQTHAEYFGGGEQK